MAQETIPISTQWLLDAVGDTGKVAVNSVYLVYSPKTMSKGSAFHLTNGVVITNEHVVRGSIATDLIAVSSAGSQISFQKIIVDVDRDLAALIPTKPLSGGLSIGDDTGIQVGQLVLTWGFPLGYNGPAPLLSVGYLSGFNSRKANPNSSPVKHLIVNAAFNLGNSGGPLLLQNSSQVVGVVVNKAVPYFTPFVQSAINAFANNKSGVIYTGTDDKGQPISLVESQLVAEVVSSLRNMAQVMIGEAISVTELKDFLAKNGL